MVFDIHPLTNHMSFQIWFLQGQMYCWDSHTNVVIIKT